MVAVQRVQHSRPGHVAIGPPLSLPPSHPPRVMSEPRQEHWRCTHGGGGWVGDQAAAAMHLQ